MKILVIGDPHGKLPVGLSKIVKKNKVEVIICLGDIPFTPKKAWLEEVWTKAVIKKSTNSYKQLVDKLCSYNLPVLTLRGNMFHGEYTKVTYKIFKKHKNLFHRTVGSFSVKGKTFILIDMLYEPHNLRGRKRLSKRRRESVKRREKKLNLLLEKANDFVLVSHVPPYKILDKVTWKERPKEWKCENVGSKILLKAIKKHKPKYVFCGHIHEAKGKKRVGKTEVYNVGCCGDYLLLDI